MTNYENIKSLSKEELAWFLMAYSDACRTCIYKTEDECGMDCRKSEGDRDTCIGGTEKWLLRETESNEDDKFMFLTSRNNVVVGEYNKKLESGKHESI